MMTTGCSSPHDAQYYELAPQKWGTGEVLRDLAPMVERIPTLQSAKSVVYLGGPRTKPAGERVITVPGPTDLWIDAIVTFDPDDPLPREQCESLDTAQTVDGEASPEPVPELAGEITDALWLECAPGAFPAPGWNVSAFLDPDNHVVFLRLTSL